jgi:YgiT-type zinc finger domain-containing protein
VTRTYGKGRAEVLIRNVPVVACGTCGETYMTAAVLHEVERLKMHRASLGEKKPVKVVEFGSRATIRARPNLPLQRAAQERRR